MRKSAPKDYVSFKGPLIIYNDIKNDQISWQKEEEIHEEFQSELNEILKGNSSDKSKDQISAVEKNKKAKIKIRKFACIEKSLL